MATNLLASNGAMSWIIIGIIAALLIAFFVWSYISQKKKQKNFNETINAIKPGSKVKTIGGVCGEVVEINDDENTFVLKTGTSDGEYSYLKFDKQAIYQTDAKPELAAPAAPAAAAAPAEEKKADEEKPAEEKSEEEENK